MPSDNRISNSFTEPEIKVLTFLFKTLQRGGDPRIVVRNRAFSNLSTKILKMEPRLEEKKRAAAASKIEDDQPQTAA